MSSEKPILYSYWRSSCSWRVRISLAWKSIDYEYVAVHLVEGGQHDDEYKAKRNPMAQVPSLHIDDVTLSQSVAILEYLEETRSHNGQSSLLPADAKLRAKVRQVVELINSGIQPIQNFAVLKKIGDEGKIKWGCHWIHKGFVALEAVLAASSGSYCVGDSVTLADAVLVPQVYNARRFGVELEQFPNIVRIDKALGELDAFKQAHPDAQPDAQK
jgi:maleylacetoacetate isomerase